MLLQELTQLLESNVNKLADDYTNEVYLQDNPRDDEVMASIEKFLKNKVPSNQIKKIANQIYLQLGVTE